MRVSVVVPTRNRSALLAMTLRSVLRQQDVDLEVIVVDEASTDDTPNVLAALGDRRIRVIRHDVPRGVAAARNHGGMEAAGEWVTFLDDDDLWAPDKIARQLHAADAAGRDWAYTGAVNFIDGRVTSGKPPLPPEEAVVALLRYDSIPGGGSNVIVRRATWLLAGPFDGRLRNTEDWEMWIRLSKLGLPACVCSPLVARRLHASNSTHDIAEIVRGTKLIEAIHHTRADWGRLHLWMAETCLRSGQPRVAVAQLLKAAVRGEARLAASELSTLFRRRLGGAMRTEGEERPASDPWIEAAAAWLQDLQRGSDIVRSR